MLRRAIEMGHNDGLAHNVLGNILVRLGRTVDAKEHFRESMRLAPNHVWPYRNLGLVLEREGSAAEAFESYCEGVNADPRFTEGHRKVAALVLRRDRTFEVEDALGRLRPALEAALASGVDDPSLVNSLVLALIETETAPDIEAAEERLSKWLDQFKSRYLLATLGRVQSLSDRPAEAVATLEAALRLPNPLRFLADELAEHRRAALPDLPTYGSIDAALAAGHHEGSSRHAAYLQGRLLQLSDRHREAVEKLREAASADGGSAEPIRALVESLRALGELPAAEKEARAALEGRFFEDGQLWEQWLAMNFVDLSRSPADVLASIPRNVVSEPLQGYPAELVWLLEQLEAGTGVRLNCGGGDYRDSRDVLWGSDRFFLGGETGAPNIDWTLTGEVQGTDDDPLYRSERWFAKDELAPHGYRIPLPRDAYHVTLHFCEVYFAAAGYRRFSVAIEGKEVLKDHEPFAAGFATAHKVKFENQVVDDGFLDVELLHVLDDPQVSAIEIESVER